KTFGRVKPFDRCPLRTKAGAGARMIEVSHDVIAAPLKRRALIVACAILPRFRAMRQDAPHVEVRKGVGVRGLGLSRVKGGKRRMRQALRENEGGWPLFFGLPECYREPVKSRLWRGFWSARAIGVWSTRRGDANEV